MSDCFLQNQAVTRRFCARSQNRSRSFLVSICLWLSTNPLTKSHSNKSTRSKQNNDNNKKRKAEDLAPDNDKSKSIKKANVAFDNSMDLHIYTVRESTTDPIDLQDSIFSDVMPSTLTADNLISMDPVPYKTLRRG